VRLKVKALVRRSWPSGKLGVHAVESTGTPKNRPGKACRPRPRATCSWRNPPGNPKPAKEGLGREGPEKIETCRVGPKPTRRAGRSFVGCNPNRGLRRPGAVSWSATATLPPDRNCDTRYAPRTSAVTCGPALQCQRDWRADEPRWRWLWRFVSARRNWVGGLTSKQGD